jgi:hypothetical protein
MQAKKIKYTRRQGNKNKEEENLKTLEKENETINKKCHE